MRLAIALLTAIWCTGCTFFQKPAAQASASQQAVVTASPPPVADAPAKFECSDGTISTSQDACLLAMARARLPPSQTVERMPADPGKPH
jgi:hypothetical protein